MKKYNYEVFDFQCIAYEEMFNNLKYGIMSAICEYENLEKVDDVIYIETGCGTRFAYADNGDLLSTVILELVGYSSKFPCGKYYHVEFNPFEINLLVLWHGERKKISSEYLSNSFMGFMINYFPESDYLKRKDKYLKDCQIAKNVRDNMVFGN